MRNVDFALIVVFLFHSVVRSCKKRKENYTLNIVCREIMRTPLETEQQLFI